MLTAPTAVIYIDCISVARMNGIIIITKIIINFFIALGETVGSQNNEQVVKDNYY